MITKKRELNTQLTDDIFSQNFDHLKCLHQTTHKVFLNIFLIYLPFVSFSTVIVSKSGKGRPPAARRSTVDDKSTLMTCIENGKFTKAAKISPGEQSNACPLSQQRVLSNKCAWNGTTGFDSSVCLLETFTKLIEKSLSVNLLIDFNYFSVMSNSFVENKRLHLVDRENPYILYRVRPTLAFWSIQYTSWYLIFNIFWHGLMEKGKSVLRRRIWGVNLKLINK